MKARPIIFSADMVRALLDGRKTQARRVVKVALPNGADAEYIRRVVRCPYGQPGDLLWVRETWRPFMGGFKSGVYYRAGGTSHLAALYDHVLAYMQRRGGVVHHPDINLPLNDRWRSPIHMPRWASRLTLRITDVRVQRVQEMTAFHFGCEGVDGPAYGEPDEPPEVSPGWRNCADEERLYMLPKFKARWDALNAKRGYGWDANPWVWAMTFEVIHKNVDEVA